MSLPYRVFAYDEFGNYGYLNRFATIEEANKAFEDILTKDFSHNEPAESPHLRPPKNTFKVALQLNISSGGFFSPAAWEDIRTEIKKGVYRYEEVHQKS